MQPTIITTKKTDNKNKTAQLSGPKSRNTPAETIIKINTGMNTISKLAIIQLLKVLFMQIKGSDVFFWQQIYQ